MEVGGQGQAGLRGSQHLAEVGKESRDGQASCAGAGLLLSLSVLIAGAAKTRTRTPALSWGIPAGPILHLSLTSGLRVAGDGRESQHGGPGCQQGLTPFSFWPGHLPLLFSWGTRGSRGLSLAWVCDRHRITIVGLRLGAVWACELRRFAG